MQELTTLNILTVALFMYAICLFLYFKFKIKWILTVTSVLWFIPIMIIDNILIAVFSVIMIIVTITISLFNGGNEF